MGHHRQADFLVEEGQRSQEQRDCSFNDLSLNSRKIMNAMFLALVQGVDNGWRRQQPSPLPIVLEIPGRQFS
jgi:hypothetical protein